MPSDAPAGTRRPKPSELRRWLGIALRTAHLAAVSAVAIGLHGQPGWMGWAGPLLALTGIALLVAELADGRVHLAEAAGALVLVKLALTLTVAFVPFIAQPVFWVLVVVSSVSSHAPRGLRHWPRA